MPNILMGVTGSVASIRAPALYSSLSALGMEVKIVATAAATYFFDPLEIDPAAPNRNPSRIILDEDEWPGRDTGIRYQRSEQVMHIELRRWADLFVIAPLDANTLAKIANGLCDNCLTCVWRAWDTSRPVVLAPAMNTLMWQHPLTRQHLRQIAAHAGISNIQGHSDESAILRQINEQSATMRIVPPIIKELACGDTGVGAMAEIPDITNAVRHFFRRN